MSKKVKWLFPGDPGYGAPETLKLGFCATGKGGGIDNSCGGEGGGAGAVDGPTTKQLHAAMPKGAKHSADGSTWKGTSVTEFNKSLKKFKKLGFAEEGREDDGTRMFRHAAGHTLETFAPGSRDTDAHEIFLFTSMGEEDINPGGFED